MNKTDYFWYPEAIEKLEVMFDGGHSSGEIAKEFNKSYDTVSKYCDRLLLKKGSPTLKIPRIRTEYTVEDKLRFGEAIKLYGRNWVLISKHLGTKSVDQV